MVNVPAPRQRFKPYFYAMLLRKGGDFRQVVNLPVRLCGAAFIDIATQQELLAAKLVQGVECSASARQVCCTIFCRHPFKMTKRLIQQYLQIEAGGKPRDIAGATFIRLQIGRKDFYRAKPRPDYSVKFFR